MALAMAAEECKRSDGAICAGLNLCCATYPKNPIVPTPGRDVVFLLCTVDGLTLLSYLPRGAVVVHLERVDLPSLFHVPVFDGRDILAWLASGNPTRNTPRNSRGTDKHWEYRYTRLAIFGYSFFYFPGIVCWGRATGFK